MSAAVNVVECGAKADGISDDAAAIQSALDQGGTVSIPEGTYKIGKTLRVGSNTKIVADANARVFLADGAGVDRDTFVLTNKPEAKSICIQGGIWDGNNPGNPRSEGLFSKGYTGVLLNFINLQDLTIRDITVRDPEAFFIRVGELANFIFDGITFEAPNLRPNQDGVHLGGFCSDGEIRNVKASSASTPNDDVIALNADDAIDRVINQGMKLGPQRRIRIENVNVSDAHTLIRMLSIGSLIEDIDIKDVSGGFHKCAINADAARYCATPLFDEADPKYRDGVGRLRNIRVQNLSARKTENNETPALRFETRMENFEIRDYSQDYAEGIAESAAPTIQIVKTPVKGLTIEGLPESEIESLCGSAASLQNGSQPGSLKGDLTKDDQLVSFCKGFKRFAVSGSPA